MHYRAVESRQNHPFIRIGYDSGTIIRRAIDIMDAARGGMSLHARNFPVPVHCVNYENADAN